MSLTLASLSLFWIEGSRDLKAIREALRSLSSHFAFALSVVGGVSLVYRVKEAVDGQAGLEICEPRWVGVLPVRRMPLFFLGFGAHLRD